MHGRVQNVDPSWRIILTYYAGSVGSNLGDDLEYCAGGSGDGMMRPIWYFVIRDDPIGKGALSVGSAELGREQLGI